MWYSIEHRKTPWDWLEGQVIVKARRDALDGVGSACNSRVQGLVLRVCRLNC